MKKKIGWFIQSRFPPLYSIKRELKKRRKSQHLNKPVPSESELPLEERQLIEQIREHTRQRNANNVTRTVAYLDFYHDHQEIHWAFLAHMVSRNAGWNMTDLRGELLSRLFSSSEQKDFFAFLERGNWLIFQDAYPQLLLYEASMKRGNNLFHLLPFFHVSVFMETIWNYFWKSGNRELLTTALIVNEQKYIEPRVIQNAHYQKTVLQTIQFKLQDLLGFSQIVFPTNQASDLLGQTVHHFASAHERILFGKRLYSLLFKQDGVLRKVAAWAVDHPHTGSRKDYWPRLFHDVNESVPGVPYKPKTDHCQLKPGAKRLYSPMLKHVWKDVTNSEAEPGDWFNDWIVMYYFARQEEQTDGEIYDEYCRTLEKVELAVTAQTAIFDRTS
jgi:hypothetical protein